MTATLSINFDALPLFAHANEMIAREDHGKRSRNENYARVHGHLSERQAEVLAIIEAAEPHGITLDEIADRLDKPVHSVSGLITSLKNRGRVVHTSERRPTRAGGTGAVIRIATAVEMAQ